MFYFIVARTVFIHYETHILIRRHDHTCCMYQYILVIHNPLPRFCEPVSLRGGSLRYATQTNALQDVISLIVSIFHERILLLNASFYAWSPAQWHEKTTFPLYGEYVTREWSGSPDSDGLALARNVNPDVAVSRGAGTSRERTAEPGTLAGTAGNTRIRRQRQRKRRLQQRTDGRNGHSGWNGREHKDKTTTTTKKTTAAKNGRQKRALWLERQGTRIRRQQQRKRRLQQRTDGRNGHSGWNGREHKDKTTTTTKKTTAAKNGRQKRALWLERQGTRIRRQQQRKRRLQQRTDGRNGHSGRTQKDKTTATTTTTINTIKTAVTKTGRYKRHGAGTLGGWNHGSGATHKDETRATTSGRSWEHAGLCEMMSYDWFPLQLTCTAWRGSDHIPPPWGGTTLTTQAPKEVCSSTFHNCKQDGPYFPG